MSQLSVAWSVAQSMAQPWRGPWHMKHAQSISLLNMNNVANVTTIRGTVHGVIHGEVCGCRQLVWHYSSRGSWHGLWREVVEPPHGAMVPQQGRIH